MGVAQRLASAPRVAAVVLLAAALVLLAAAPALAHSRAEYATSFDSRVVRQPDTPMTAWEVLGGGDLLAVAHDGTEELIVLGYEGEPYLRISPRGVEENRRSPASYLNAERYGDIVVPPHADAEAPPEWRPLADEPRHAWHDHRVHWMAPTPPPSVRGASGELLVQEWSVPVLVDGRADAVHGELWWVPASIPWLWLLLGAALTAPALAGLRARRDPARLVTPAAVVLITVAVVNLFLIVDELTWPAPLVDQLFGALHQILFIGAGVGGAVWAMRSTSVRFLALGIGSGAVLFHQGLLPIRMLWSPELPSIWPPALLRGLVALSLMQAVWIAVVIARGLSGPGEPAAPATPGDTTPARTAV